jgi:SPP1 gp7 family putative phage head morphogenesis protein
MTKEIQKIFQTLENKLILLSKKASLNNTGINAQMKEALNEAYNQLESLLDKSLAEQARSRYNYMYRAIEEGIQENLPNGTLTDESIRNAVYASLGGSTITQRLNRHKSNLYRDATTAMQRTINEAISQGMSRGDSIDKITKEVKSILNTSRYNARRIARTEAHRMREWGTRQGLDEAHRYSDMFDDEWLATNDGRTRSTHMRLNHQIADADGYFHIDGKMTRYPGGFGIASEDIHCRCTVIANFDRVLGDNPEYVDNSDLTMEQWLNKPDLQGKYAGLSSVLTGNELRFAVAYINGLNPDYYPKQVISDFLKLEVAQGGYTYEDQIKANLRKVYLKYLKTEYDKMGIKTSFSDLVDIEDLGKHLGLIKHVKNNYPGLSLKELIYSSEHHNNYGMGYYQPSKKLISINTNMTRLDKMISKKITEKEQLIEDGISWSAQTDSKYDRVESTLIHEIGHAISLDGDIYRLTDLDIKDVYTNVSGYALEASNKSSELGKIESVAETFVNGVLSSTPDKRSLNTWEKLGFKLEEWNNVEYAKLLF